MEHQNNNKQQNGAAPAAQGATNQGARRPRHRGGRGRGGKGGENRGENRGGGQDIRTKPGNYINEAPAPIEHPAPKERPAHSERPAQNESAAGGGRPQGQQQKGHGKKNRGRRHGERDQERKKKDAEAAAVETGVKSAPRGGREVSSRPSPALTKTVGDGWLDDTFSALHEKVEIHDPDAEEAARRILDAEGPLLFREDTEEIEEMPDADEKRVEVVGVRFSRPGKVYFFQPGNFKLKSGTFAIVETARGEEYGEVCRGNVYVPASEVVQPLRPVLRAATEEDSRHNEDNRRKEEEAFRICQQKIAEHDLDMKLVEAQYTFDNSKLLFYFTSDGRVDFRDLVKDLAGVFRTRIELRQIGIRDEAKLLGGLGTCGRPLCCSGFLPDFVQVSIKMAKEQNLSLNSTKISGCCGRLMCCLRYEVETYEKEIRLTPSVGSAVETADGRGTVVGNHPLKGTVTVRLADQPDEAPRVYHRDTVTLCKRERPEQRRAEPQARVEDGADDAAESAQMDGE